MSRLLCLTELLRRAPRGRDDCLAPGAALAYRDLGAAGNRGQLQSYRVTLPSATMTEPTGVW
jgi:hypothetical protein